MKHKNARPHKIQQTVGICWECLKAGKPLQRFTVVYKYSESELKKITHYSNNINRQKTQKKQQEKPHDCNHNQIYMALEIQKKGTGIGKTGTAIIAAPLVRRWGGGWGGGQREDMCVGKM